MVGTCVICQSGRLAKLLCKSCRHRLLPVLEKVTDGTELHRMCNVYGKSTTDDDDDDDNDVSQSYRRRNKSTCTKFGEVQLLGFGDI